jgi:holliday junction DNA helicase RuvA
MYDFVRGILAEKSQNSAIVDAGGVGYAFQIPVSTFEALPETGIEVKILAHLSIREDAHKLYGFFTRAERDLFRRLIDVNMVGPKVALNILSNIKPGQLVQAISSGDASRLKSIPGIGPKMAQRLVVELRGVVDKMEIADVPQAGKVAGKLPAPEKKSRRQESYTALMSLGYTDKQVLKALERVESVVAADASLEEWVRATLQVI